MRYLYCHVIVTLAFHQSCYYSLHSDFIVYCLWKISIPWAVGVQFLKQDGLWLLLWRHFDVYSGSFLAVYCSLLSPALFQNTFNFCTKFLNILPFFCPFLPIFWKFACMPFFPGPAVVNFQYILHFSLVFFLLTLNR